MFPRTIRGRFTEIPSWRGRDGIRIPEFGLAAHTSSSEAASESAGSAVLDGAGGIGDSIGVADTQCTTMAGTTPGAERFITGAVSTGQEVRAAQGSARAAESPTVAAQPPGLSTEISKRLEDTLHPAVRPAHVRAHSAATTMADRPRATRRAAAPVLAAVQRGLVAEAVELVVVEAGVVNLSTTVFLAVCKISRWRESICGGQI